MSAEGELDVGRLFSFGSVDQFASLDGNGDQDAYFPWSCHPVFVGGGLVIFGRGIKMKEKDRRNCPVEERGKEIRDNG